MSKKKISKSEKYTNDFLNWQKNQYSPGYYTGGNFPLDIKYGGKKFGYYLLFQGVLIIFLAIAMILGGGSDPGLFLVIALAVFLGIFCIWAGLKRVGLIKSKK